MPQAALVAGIQAAGTLGAAQIGANSARSGQRSQAKAGMNALGSEIRNQKRQEQRYQQEWDDYQRRHEEWRNRNFPQTLSGPGGRPSVPRQNAPAGPGPMPQTSQGSLADLFGTAPMAAAALPQRPSMANLFDWQNYGV